MESVCRTQSCAEEGRTATIPPSLEPPKQLLDTVQTALQGICSTKLRSVLTPGESGVRQSVGFPKSGVRHVVLTNVLTLDHSP